MPISIDNATNNIVAGGGGQDGDISLLGTDGSNRIRLDGQGGNVWLGGNGTDGDLLLYASSGDNSTIGEATIHLDGSNGNMTMRSTAGQNRIRIDPASANVWVGGNGADGDLLLFAASGDNSTAGEATIHLNGEAGDIVLRNADCAEDFPIENAPSVEPGTVLIIGGDTQLRVCSEAYDKRVAGVVAGAGTYKPGIILGRKEDQRHNSLPVALMGRVYCKVDSRDGAIEVGDLLTTSPTPGHAMKVADPMKAFGAVIGKALEPISRRMGMIPILVALQ